MAAFVSQIFRFQFCSMGGSGDTTSINYLFMVYIMSKLNRCNEKQALVPHSELSKALKAAMVRDWQVIYWTI